MSDPDVKKIHRQQVKADAEERLAHFAEVTRDLSGKPLDEIIHELLVHQEELKIQNEELKKTQMELETSRDQYIDLYDFSPVGYFTLSAEALITEVNLTGASLLGITRRDLIHTRFRGFVAEPGFKTWDHFFVSVLKHGKQQSCIIQLKRKNKELIFASIDGIRIEKEKDPVQVRLAVSDITVQYEVTAKKEHSAQRIRSLLDLYQQTSLSDKEFLNFVLDKSLEVVQSRIGFIGLINEDETEITGHAWSPDTMASCAVQNVPVHFPIAKAGVWTDSVRKRGSIIINDYETCEFEKKNLPEGHLSISRLISVPVIIGSRIVAVITLANKSTPYDDEDEKALRTLAHTAWELLYHRLTEQNMKDSEQKLKKAQDIGRFGNVSYDFHMKQIRFSDGVFRIFGIDQFAFSCTKEQILMYFHPEDRELVQKIFSDIVRNSSRISHDLRILRPDGDKRWIQVILEKTSDENGNLVGIEGTIQDITDQKRSLADHAKALEQISHNLELMAILNDEIRNPLSIIVAMMDMEGNENCRETVFKAVDDIDEIVRKLDKGWLKSDKIRSFLKLHYNI